MTKRHPQGDESYRVDANPDQQRFLMLRPRSSKYGHAEPRSPASPRSRRPQGTFYIIREPPGVSTIGAEDRLDWSLHRDRTGTGSSTQESSASALFAFIREVPEFLRTSTSRFFAPRYQTIHNISRPMSSLARRAPPRRPASSATEFEAIVQC